MEKSKQYFKPYMGLPISVYVIFVSSIINNMGNFVMPLLAMFLKFKAGMDASIVGVIVALNSLIGMFGSIIGGKLIDRIGRKKIFIVFRTLSGVCTASAAIFINNEIVITAIIMLASLLHSFSLSAYSTMIADLTEGEQRKAGYSLEYIAINIGYSVGPLLAAFLFNNFLVWLFLGDAITTFISIILVAVFVPETMPSKEKILEKNSHKQEAAEQGSLLRALIRRPALAVFSLIMVLYFIVFSQFSFGLPLQAGDTFGVKAGPTIYGILLTINAVMCSTLTVFITAAIKNIKPSLSIALGGVFYVIGFGMIFFISTPFMFIVSTIIWTLGEIMVSTNTSVYISEHTPISHRGRFNSIFPIIRKLGFMGGPLIAGFYVRYLGLKNLWIFVAGLSLVAGLMMYKLYRMDLRKNIEEVVA